MTKTKEEMIAEKIKASYTERQPTKLEALRALDARVKRPATVFAYIWGSISAIIMGCGMSLIMTNIGEIIKMTGDNMLIGIIIGSVGLILSLLTYPIFKGILKSRQKKYAEKIITLSDEITSK